MKQRPKSAKAAAERAEKEYSNKQVYCQCSRVEFMPTYLNNWLTICLVTSCDSSTTTCPTSGTSNIEGATILLGPKITTTEIITLTITDENGNVTSMSVPIGDFVF